MLAFELIKNSWNIGGPLPQLLHQQFSEKNWSWNYLTLGFTETCVSHSGSCECLQGNTSQRFRYPADEISPANFFPSQAEPTRSHARSSSSSPFNNCSSERNSRGLQERITCNEPRLQIRATCIQQASDFMAIDRFQQSQKNVFWRRI